MPLVNKTLWAVELPRSTAVSISHLIVWSASCTSMILFLLNIF